MKATVHQLFKKRRLLIEAVLLTFILVSSSFTFEIILNLYDLLYYLLLLIACSGHQ